MYTKIMTKNSTSTIMKITIRKICIKMKIIKS